METTRLGRTNLMVTRTAFGVLPLQRTEKAEAARILRRAQEAGITYYDTARAYSDSEEKIGAAFAGIRDQVIIATKTGATTREKVLADLETSLRNLRTDYVDILQLHNPGVLPDPEDSASSYAALLEARRAGKIRFIGISQHSIDRAITAVESGWYDTVQFPLSYLSDARDLEIIDVCKAADVGLIAMKALSGGLITDARPAFAYLRQYDNVVPIWGMQHLHELEQILALDANPPAMTAEFAAIIAQDRQELAADFCRACGYCLPCPAEIPIPMAARMGLLLRRAPYQGFLSAEWRAQMRRIENCLDCGHCRAHCPYGLDTPTLLHKMLADYEQFAQEHGVG